MVKGSYTLQALKKLFVAASMFYTLNTAAQTENTKLDTTKSDTIQSQIIKHKEYAVGKQLLDLEKKAGWDVKESDYKSLEFFVNALEGYLHPGGNTKEYEKEKDLKNLKAIVLEFEMHHYIYKDNPNMLFHESLRNKELSPFTALMMYLETGKKENLPWAPGKAGEHLFLKTKYCNWDPILGIEQTDKDYEKLMAKEEDIKELEIGDLMLIGKRNIGFALNKKQEYDKAIKYLDGVLETEPYNSKAYKYRGDSYNGKKDYGAAIDDYESAIKFNQSFKEAYIDLGDVHLRKRNWEKAAEDYTKALKFDPENASLYAKRGYANRKDGKSKKAQKDFIKAQGLMFLYKQ